MIPIQNSPAAGPFGHRFHPTLSTFGEAQAPDALGAVGELPWWDGQPAKDDDGGSPVLDYGLPLPSLGAGLGGLAVDPLVLASPIRPLFLGQVVAGGPGAAAVGDGAANGVAPYRLPLPSTPLPGPSREWTSGALDVLLGLQERGLAGPFLDRFLNSGAVFTLVPIEGGGDKGRYNPDDDALKLPPEFFDGANGSLSGDLSRDRVTTLVHELWHAYRDQVLRGGWDPTTQGVFDRAVQWLRTTTVVAKSGDSKGTSSPFADAGIADAAEFLDEYVGALLNDLVPTWLRLQKEVRDGGMTGAEADASWQRHVARIRSGTTYEAYEDADAPTYQVQGAPPVELVDHLLDLFGMRGF